jgi:N6-L-threonylcarbamoyladenine synthase
MVEATMHILSIETSCDETAVSIVEAQGTFPHARYRVLGNALFSQIDIHREYGGVFPMLAKREHAKTLVPMLERALGEASMLTPEERVLSGAEQSDLMETLVREPGLGEALTRFLEQYREPDIDLIAVTTGPGLEPALWVGINFARALAQAWNVPVVPVNHMEGHVLSSIFDGETIPELAFPAISLLISGGHTELILMKEWGRYERLGETRDDAVGEAFDKVARMLGLPYPGGPEISTYAKEAREKQIQTPVQLPRPMLDSEDLDFSFSGLKTAVRYATEKRAMSRDEQLGIARDFEESVTTVLLRKTLRAVELHGAQTVIIGGGVSANTYIRESFATTFREKYPMVTVYVPPRNLSTDNSIMIALAGHAKKDMAEAPSHLTLLHANGNLALDETR